MATRLFGTDGVRGTAGQPPLDRPTIRRIGAALVRALPAARPQLLLGRDTRESGSWIERELAYGATWAGARVTSVGVLSTPAVAYLTGADAFDAGIVISASHNPFEDNGIKVFSGAGEKFTERLEAEVEAIVHDASWAVPEDEAGPVPQVRLEDAYLAHVRKALPGRDALGSLPLAIDCANGATSTLAPRLFSGLGFEVTALACEPNGRNINLGCGSTHPERLSAAVCEGGLRLGVAFDGDGDRAIFVDHRGQVVNGDAVMLMCARHLQREGRLPGSAIVATVMSNIGLEIALRESGIEMVRCPVGDKYVMEEMMRRGLALGGEQSGHIIFSEFLYTGDGVITALNVLQVMAATGRELADLAAELRTYPQVLINVRVREKADYSAVPAIADVIADVERRLGGDGRLLVRYSGTEPLLRVMLEGKSQDEIGRWARDIVETVKVHLG